MLDKFWKSSSLLTKIQMVLIVAMAIYIGISGAYYRNLIYKERKEAIKKSIDSLALTERKKDTLWYNKRKYRNSVRKKSDLIDKKLQQDEEAINNAVVTDERRLRYLSKHQKR